MINIQKKEDCCGCNACVQRCPKHCITMKIDTEGFAYPKVDEEVCIHCGLCEKVCPIINVQSSHRPLSILAAKNTQESVRMRSSSGGVFYLLATEILQQGGVVFGAAYNSEWMVEHKACTTIEELDQLLGSKYVQSNISASFKNVETLLKKGVKVLFCGTPCQVYGLKGFLRKSYDNLLMIDFVCHGVPSPGVWSSYLKEIVPGGCLPNIKSIDFRNKATGWKNYSFHMEYMSKGQKCTINELHRKNVYFKGFLSDLYLRPSCYHCPFKGGQNASDITLADGWGIEKVAPEFYDDKGISSILCNTSNGQNYTASIVASLKTIPIHYDDIVKYNPAYVKSSPTPVKRVIFFNLLHKNGVSYAVNRCTKVSLTKRIFAKIKRYI